MLGARDVLKSWYFAMYVEVCVCELIGAQIDIHAAEAFSARANPIVATIGTLDLAKVISETVNKIDTEDIIFIYLSKLHKASLV